MVWQNNFKITKIVLITLSLCPLIAYAAEQESNDLKLRLNYKDIPNKEVELNKKFKEQDTTQIPKKLGEQTIKEKGEHRSITGEKLPEILQPKVNKKSLREVRLK